jgi:FkbM family methyltransferase
MKPISEFIFSLNSILSPAKTLLKYYLKYFPIYWQGSFLFTGEENSGQAFQMITGVYETYTNSVIQKHVKEGDTVCDVGAHVGDHTVFLSKLVGKNGKVFALEPGKRNFELLQKNVRFNGLKNVSPARIALSDKQEKMRLYLSSDSTDNRVGIKKGNRKVEIVNSNSLDNLFPDGNIDFIKIDVQGWEIPCLQGMKKLSQKNSKLKMIVEFWPKGIQEAGMRPVGLYNVLQRYGFSIFILSEQNNKKLKINEYRQLEKSTGEEGYVNLLCLKR